MNFRNIMAAPLVAAIAGLCHLTAQAAAPGGTDLRSLTQNWDRTLSAEPGGLCPASSARFTCVMNNAAVRDNETGLVWGQPQQASMFWWGARRTCANDTTGGRKGWRLPTVSELASLVDPNSVYAIKLPLGHPFTYVAAYNGYWTATQDGVDQPLAGTYANAWIVRFQYSAVPEGAAGEVARIGKETLGNTWCVRGGESPGGAY